MSSREGTQRPSSQQGETEMNDLEMTEIASGARELSDAELAMVAGGSVWSDLGKLAGGVIGRAVAGTFGATYGVAAVILVQAIYNAYTPGQPLPSTPIQDAAL
jgi:hypothetical protein